MVLSLIRCAEVVVSPILYPQQPKLIVMNYNNVLHGHTCGPNTRNNLRGSCGEKENTLCKRLMEQRHTLKLHVGEGVTSLELRTPV